MGKGKKRRRSIFSRLVMSYVVFLAATLIIYLVGAIVLIAYIGNGSFDNASPQTVVKTDGTINDMEVLDRVGGWVEELDEKGNVIEVIGEKRTEKYKYTMGELAGFVDLGYVPFNISGVVIKTGGERAYSACARYVGSPKRIFLVFYPSNMVDCRLSYIITNGSGNKNAGFLWIFLGFFVLEIAIISLYLKKHIDKPLKLLMAGMDDVSEGKRDVVLDYKTDREFEDIRDRFNLMAQKLKESEDERHRTLQSRNQMLLELAHDIKNPVASIKSSIIALEEGLVAEEKKPAYYKTIEVKAERISTLADDINTSLKMESDKYKLNTEKADICEVVRRISAEFYEEITDNGKDFDIDIQDTPIWGDIDVKLFGRVVGNLLNNANKYNDSGELIKVQVYEKACTQKHEANDGTGTGHNEVFIEVMDDGDAIDKAFVPRLFEAFSRGDANRKTDGGTGLGLAIASKIIEKHGGTLEYKRKENMNCFCIKLNFCMA